MKDDKICIIGSGNVATHLLKAWAGIDVVAVNAHTLDGLPDDASVYLIAVKDDAIEEVAKKIPQYNSIVAHTSGSVPMEAVARHHRCAGVLYPLQTFSKEAEMVYSDIPVFIEATDIQSADTLKRIAYHFTSSVYDASSAIRRTLHIAAVFGCNFVNHLYAYAADELKGAGLPFDILRPLAVRTLEKAFDSGHPERMQTGPAARGDINILKEHLRQLEGKTEAQNIYRLLSQDILLKHKQ